MIPKTIDSFDLYLNTYTNHVDPIDEWVREWRRMMPFFRVIIPTYGNEPLLEEAIKSIKRQSIASEIEIIVVHDNADKVGISEQGRVMDVYVEDQHWNGGARNIGLKYASEAVYTLFLDHDDQIPDPHVLEELKDFIMHKNYPDVIRLPYTKYYVEKKQKTTKSMKDEESFDAFVNSSRVAPWTKCVKTSLIPSFPENTVFEDVLHHLKVCDICSTYERFSKPVVEWRMWDGQTSKKKGAKWESSKWRFVADLKDFEPKKPIVRKRLDWRIKTAIENLYKELKEKGELCI